MPKIEALRLSWPGLSGRLMDRLRSSLPEPYELFPTLDARETRFRLENAALMAEFQEIKARLEAYKEAKQTGAAVDADKARFGELIGEINNRASFTRITSHDHPALHAQLLANEKVHACDMEELLTRRLGDEKTDKACFSVVLDMPGEPVVLAGIFTYFLHTVGADGRYVHRGLPGFVDQVKRGHPEPIADDDTAVFYTISSAFPGAGVELVQRVYETLHRNFVLTTLSPVRDFTKGKDRETWLKRPAEEVQRDVLAYLLENKDPVLQFHLANGAYIGDININPDSEKDWITINYVYPVRPGRLATDKKLYQDYGFIFMSPYLHRIVQNQMPSRLSVAQSFSGGDEIRYRPPGATRTPDLP